MSKRYQNGHLRCAKRKSGLQCWEFLWRENNGNGKRVCRTAIIGTVAQLPTEQLAGAAANGLRVHINSDNKRCCIVPISILLKAKIRNISVFCSTMRSGANGSNRAGIRSLSSGKVRSDGEIPSYLNQRKFKRSWLNWSRSHG